MERDIEEANRVKSHHIADGTRKTYLRYKRKFVDWLQASDLYQHLLNESGHFDREKFAQEYPDGAPFLAYLGTMKREDGLLKGMATLKGNRTAFSHFWSDAGETMPPEMDASLSKWIAGQTRIQSRQKLVGIWQHLT